MSDKESRALLFGIIFWITVLCVLIWWLYIRPGEIRLLIPSYWWIDPCALSPASVFVTDCAADATVASMDSIAAGVLTFFFIMLLWIVQLGIVAAVPVVVYAHAERLLRT